MSFHRENVIWQSADGTWSRGFFQTYDSGPADEDWDPEWDVEYDFDELQWVSTGHASEEAAARSWNGANPGGHDLVAFRDDAEGRRRADEYDDMAARLHQSSADQTWKCTGPANVACRGSSLATS